MINVTIYKVPTVLEQQYGFFDFLKISGTMKPYDLEDRYHSVLIGFVANYPTYDYPSICNTIELQFIQDKENPSTGTITLVQFDTDDNEVQRIDLLTGVNTNNWIDFELYKIPKVNNISGGKLHTFKVKIGDVSISKDFYVNDLTVKFQLALDNVMVKHLDIEKL